MHSEFTDSVDRVAAPVPGGGLPDLRGCAAAYFPEANVLVPLDFTAHGSNTPASKAVVVRLEPSKAIHERQVDTTEGALAGV